MTRAIVPQNQQWLGGFPGEFSGLIYMTNGIDLERYKGKFSLGDTISAITTDASLTNLTTAPLAFVRTAADGTDRWWALSAKMFRSTTNDPTSTWAENTASPTGAPSAPLYDMIEFQGALLVATSTDVDRLSTTWTNSWWSGLTGAAALTANPHRFAILAGAVIYTDKNFINSYDGTVAKDPAITLPQNFNARWIKVYGDFAYIGGATVDGSEARVYAWDRAATIYNAEYPIGDIESVAGFVTGGNFYIITLNGSIKQFTGSGFRFINAFPTRELNQVITGAGGSPTGLHPNGVATDERYAKIFVNFGVNADFRLLSGIWTFDSETANLYHSHSIKNNVAKDYSQTEISSAGAIKNSVVTQGRWLIGGTAYRTYTSTTRIGIFKSDETTTSGRGYLVTTKIPAGNVRRFFREMYLHFRRLDTSTDRIRALYRIQEDNNLPAWETITWASTTTFTGTNANVAVGDFVEVLAGDNAGALAKITAISGSPTITFTIDLTLNSSTLAARARYLKFIDIGTVSSQATQSQVFRIAKRSEWIQFIFAIIGSETSPQVENYLLDYSDVPQ